MTFRPSDLRPSDHSLLLTPSCLLIPHAFTFYLVSPLTVSDLQQAGYHLTRVTDFLPSTASDEEIITLAIGEGAIIVTQDLDFSALIAQRGLAKPSVVSLRLSEAKPQIVTRILQQVLPQIQTQLTEGVIVSVEETRFRIRKLPVTS